VVPLVGKVVRENFEDKLERKYLKYAKRHVVRRGLREFRTNQYSVPSETFSLSFSSESFDDSDIYEGGEPSIQDIDEGNIPNRVKYRNYRDHEPITNFKNQRNEVRGNYKRAPSRAQTQRFQAFEDESLNEETLHYAIDLLIDEKSRNFKYKGIDERLK